LLQDCIPAGASQAAIAYNLATRIRLSEPEPLETFCAREQLSACGSPDVLDSTPVSGFGQAMRARPNVPGQFCLP
jgi:hypothetical protein